MIYKAKSLVNKRGKRKNAIYRKRKNKRKEGKKGSNEEKLSVKIGRNKCSYKKVKGKRKKMSQIPSFSIVQFIKRT